MNSAELVTQATTLENVTPASSGLPVRGAVPSLIGFIEPFFARRWTILLTLLGFILVGWITLLIWPRKYESEAKMLIRVGRESVSLDPTATTSETMMLQKTQEEEINSVLELMSSHYIKEKAVDTLGASSVIDGELPGKPTKLTELQESIEKIKTIASDCLFRVLVIAGVKDDLSDRELAVMKLGKAVNIWAPKKSAVVVIHAKSKTPEMAQAIAETVSATFLEAHLKMSRTEGSQQFFQQQAAAVELQLNERLDRRTAMLQERDISSVEAKSQALLATLANIESSVRDRLNDLELQEIQLASGLTKRHPDLQRLRRELDETRQAVQTMGDVAESNADSVEVPVSTRVPARGFETQAQSSDNPSQRLMRKKKRVQQELRVLMDFQLELHDVDREILVAEGRLDKLRTKQEEARIIDELQSKRISNVTVVQPATFVERACSPKKKILAAGFVALGLLSGLGLVVLREMGGTSVRTVHQLNSLGLHARTVGLPRRSHLLTRLQRGSRRRKDILLRLPEVRKSLKKILDEVLALKYGNSDGGMIVGVMGVNDGCGASTVATGLAMLAESEFLETTLVDADSSKRTLTKQFALNEDMRMSNVVAGDIDLSDCLQRPTSSTLKMFDATTSSRSVDVSDARQCSYWLRENNDLVVVDLPTSNTSNRVFDLDMLDCIVVVAAAEQSESVEMLRKIQRLHNNGINVSVLVLNKCRTTIPRWIQQSLS